MSKETYTNTDNSITSLNAKYKLIEKLSFKKNKKVRRWSLMSNVSESSKGSKDCIKAKGKGVAVVTCSNIKSPLKLVMKYLLNLACQKSSRETIIGKKKHSIY